MRITFVIILVFCSFLVNAQWIQTNGPFGGSVYSMVSTGTDLFALSGYETIWHSTNNGISWTKVTEPLSSADQLIYKDSMLIAIGGHVSRSTDLGNTWTWGGSINSSPVTCSVVSGSDIFVGVWGSGIYRSSDNASTWTLVNNGLGSEYVQALAVKGSTLYVGTDDQGVFKSTNNGNTWVSDSVGLNGAAIYALAVLNNEVFAGSQFQGVFRNIGGMWINVNNGLANLSAIELGTMGGNLVVGSVSGVVSYSPNSGASWNVSTSVISGTYISDFQAHNNFLFLGCNYDGVYRSSDLGVTWIETNTNLINSAVNCMTSMDSTLIAGLGNGIHMSSDQGNTWIKKNTGLTEPHVRALMVVDTSIYAATYYNLYRSDDHGNSWFEPNSNVSSAMTLAHLGNYLFYSSYNSLYRSQNNGVNWSYKFIPGLSTNITATAVSDSLIFVGSGAGLFISADSGNTWIQSTNGIGNSNIRSIFVTGNQVYASSYDPLAGTYRSTDNGNSWTLVGNGLPGGILYWAADGSNIFANGYRSTDYGNTWALHGTYPIIPGMGITILDSVVYAGMDGVYKNENLICNNTAQTIFFSSCGTYTSPSGNYTWSTSGTYADTIPNAAGCDSLLTINLTVLPAIVVNITAQGPITFCQGDSVILSGTTGFGSYQWYNRLYAIPGANGSSFTARSSGRYSCIAQDGLCADTSNIIIVHVPCISLDPAEEKFMQEIPPSVDIYPNPGNGIFTMNAPDGTILIYDSFGKLVTEIKWQQNSDHLDLSLLNDGIYLLYIKTAEYSCVRRLQIAR